MLTTSVLPDKCKMVIEETVPKGVCMPDYSFYSLYEDVVEFRKLCCCFFPANLCSFNSGMYVDPNQLRDVSEFTGLRTFVNAMVDVEKPEFESEAFRLFVFRNLEIQENLRLTNVEIPIHLR